jgi:hypothetical protein
MPQERLNSLEFTSYKTSLTFGLFIEIFFFNLKPVRNPNRFESDISSNDPISKLLLQYRNIDYNYLI